MGLGEVLLLIIILIVLFFPSKAKDLVKNVGIAVRAFQEGAREVEKELKK